VGELVGGGRDLRFDEVEHGGGTYRSAKPESSSESQRPCHHCRRRRHFHRILNRSHSGSATADNPGPNTFWEIFTVQRAA